jgi:membrane-associated protease RseP (regulator of RpoE activity)
MKKVFLIGLPIAAVLFLIVGLAYSNPEPQSPPPPHRPSWESFPRSGFRLGVVLSDDNGDEKGVAIEKILPGSPADKAGLHEGDILVRIDGERIQTSRDVREMLRNLEDSKNLQVEILRDGQPQTVTVIPEKREFPSFPRMGGRYLGINLQNLDPDLAAYFQVDPNEGVLVTRIEPDSPAAKAGFHSGDIITHINGNKISSAEDVSKIISDGDSETVEVIVLRHGTEQKLIAKPEKRDFFNHRAMMQDMHDLPQQMMNDPAFNSQMENLKNELRDLKDQMQGMRQEEIDQMRNEIQNQLKQEMDKLRSELKEKKEL